MQNEFEKLCKAEIKRANKNGELIGKNPDAGRLIDFIASGGGFWGHTQVKGISGMLYVDEPREPQKNSKARTEAPRGNYGDLRWDNLRRGNASFHPREAKFVHAALVNGFGPEWGRAFPWEVLVLLPFHEFLTRALALNLPWPDGKIAPAIAMEVVWVSQMGEALTIRPVDPTAVKLGGSPNSANRYQETTNSFPRHKAEECYFLQVRGMKPGNEKLFVFEASHEEVISKKDNEAYYGFPVRLIKPKSSNLTIKDEGDGVFKFYDIKGSFSFFAITFPQAWDFAETFGADPFAEEWRREEFEAFIRSLRRVQLEKPDTVRIGWYGYKVE